MFRDNLKEQIEFKGLIIKELAAMTGINKRTLDTYVDSRAIIPNAEIAVKLAQALDTSVEFLVTGKEIKTNQKEIEDNLRLAKKYKKLLLDLEKLTPEYITKLCELIHLTSIKE